MLAWSPAPAPPAICATAPRPGGLAGLVASLATTVADLHDLGIVHGRLSADHVSSTPANRPVLCGFGDAIRSHRRRAAASGGARRRRRARLAAAAAADVHRPWRRRWEPIPTRRLAGLAAAGRGERWQAYARRTLLNVADRATADDAAHRPDARTLAEDVLAALPEARLPGVVGATDEALLPSRVPRSSRPRWSGRHALAGVGGLAARVPWTPIVGAVGLGLLLFGLNGVLAGPRELVADDGPEALAVDEPDRSERRRVHRRPVRPPRPRPPAASTTGATCGADPAAGPRGRSRRRRLPIAGVGRRWRRRRRRGPLRRRRARRPARRGDWDCDGAATVALVERATGRVFLFDRLGRARTTTCRAASSAVVAEPTGIAVVGDAGVRRPRRHRGADGTRTEVAG